MDLLTMVSLVLVYTIMGIVFYLMPKDDPRDKNLPPYVWALSTRYDRLPPYLRYRPFAIMLLLFDFL